MTVTKEKKPMKEPKNWKVMWSLIEEMRKENLAPVDTMGAGCIQDPNADDNERAYQTLIGLMLSSQTKDEVTSATMKKLIDNGLSIPMIMDIKDSELNDLIASVGFHNKKVKYIKEATAILVSKHKSKVPNKLEDLLALPGVGQKMAHLVL